MFRTSLIALLLVACGPTPGQRVNVHGTQSDSSTTEYTACENASHCDDSDGCTNDTCVDKRCVHDAIPDCPECDPLGTEACDAKDTCDCAHCEVVCACEELVVTVELAGDAFFDALLSTGVYLQGFGLDTMEVGTTIEITPPTGWASCDVAPCVALNDNGTFYQAVSGYIEKVAGTPPTYRLHNVRFVGRTTNGSDFVLDLDGVNGCLGVFSTP